jgi:two-component system phosphate regulon sensor histidine kinase PhoR
MYESSWPVIIVVFFAVVLGIYLLTRLLGYELTKKEGRNAAAKAEAAGLSSSARESPNADLDAKSLLLALSEIEDGVLITDRNFRVQYLNNAMARTFRLAPDAWYGLTFIEVVRDHECEALLRKCFKTRQPQSLMITTHQKMQTLSVSVFPGFGDDSFLVIIRDLTEKQRIEQMRRDLVSNISHEFRTPIASIRLLVETLLQGAINDAEVLTDFLHKIDVESIKLQLMTDDLHQLSVLEGREPIPERSAVDVGKLINQTIDRLRERAGRRGIIMKSNIEHGMEKPVIDRSGVESVLMNLLHNAIKYSVTGGMITTQAKKGEGEVIITVIDTGIGIPEDDMPRIFERFYKVDKARNSEGFGLGLAISKHIVESHGGRIWVESIEGKGSSFHFTLPLSTQK